VTSTSSVVSFSCSFLLFLLDCMLCSLLFFQSLLIFCHSAVFDVSSVFGDESRVLDGDSVEFKVEENMNGNGNKEKKISQKISTGDGSPSCYCSQ